MAKKKKNPEPPFDHWQELVEVFFQFCKDNFGASPSFDGSAPRDMKIILTQLRKRAEEKNKAWVLEEAVSRWKAFLSLAYRDEWLKNHWTLANLNRQKDTLFLRVSSLKPVKQSPTPVTMLPSQDVYDYMN